MKQTNPGFNAANLGNGFLAYNTGDHCDRGVGSASCGRVHSQSFSRLGLRGAHSLLKAAGQCRVALSLRQEHSRAGDGPRRARGGERALQSLAQCNQRLAQASAAAAEGGRAGRSAQPVGRPTHAGRPARKILVLESWVKPCGKRLGIRKGVKGHRTPTQDPSTDLAAHSAGGPSLSPPRQRRRSRWGSDRRSRSS